MLTATFSQLRNRAKEYFDRIESGETIQIYRHGKPVALLTPFQRRKPQRFDRQDPLRIDGVSLSQAIMAERKEDGG